MLKFLNENPTILSFIVLVISSGLILLGWNVIYKNAKKIASRNETFNLLSNLLVNIDELTSESISFWSSLDDKNEILKSKRLELEVVKLKRSLDQLNRRGITFQLNLEIRKLRRAITLDSNNKSSVPKVLIQLKVEDLYLYSSELQNKLILAFQNKHPVT